MIIGNLYIARISFMPFKTNPPLPVDAYSILPFSISPQSMKSIAWIKHQRFKARRSMKDHESFSCLSLKRLKATNSFIVKEPFSFSASK